MVPLFPTITTEDGSSNNQKPISIQRLVPQQTTATHQFKHLPAGRLQSAVARAAADLQLEQTTRSLLQALNLQQTQPTSGSAERRQRRPGPSRAELDQTAHSDSEVSSISHRRDNEACDSVQHIPTATTLLSEQATQTQCSAEAGRPGGGQLPSLHLLRTLRGRLVSALQQVGQLRAQAPWQSRVLDQLDWDRKVARMDEFHAKITREMYILTRQVDLIMDNVCSIPRTRVTSSLKGDVIRKLVRAHRSALRVTQAFAQNYWDGSLDGRQAGRFLQLLSVCRSLTDVCQHLDLESAEIADLPERLAAMVRQHVTTAGDVGSLIREMALGRFGPAAAEAAATVSARSGGRARPTGTARSRGHPAGRQPPHRVKSTIDRLRSGRPGEKLSVRSAPTVRRPAGRPRAARPGSAPHAVNKARAGGERAPLPPLPEEGDASSSDEDPWSRAGPGPADWSAPDRPPDVLTATVEQAVRRALSEVAAAPGLPGETAAQLHRRGDRGGTESGTERLTDRRDAGDREQGAGEAGGRVGPVAGGGDSPDGPPDSQQQAAEGRGPAGNSTSGDRPARRRSSVKQQTKREAERSRRQLRHVLARLEELQRQRAVIRRRWAPLLLARSRSEEDAIYLDMDPDLDSAELDLTAAQVTGGGTGRQGTHPGVELTAAQDTGRQGTRADAATSTSTLAVPPEPGPGAGLGADQRRCVRDVFAAEALDPRLRTDLTEQLRGLLGSCDDSAVSSLPQELVNQLVDEFISEAGVDIFLQQLFNQEFELR
ncbi:uncharacterized protein LOC122393311 [Amphibalanus amphitrite]|uniref:uncharacterized protein LOC122393311 n=1 Tax=Amphibalanus amphitrite TaxID=1232801 RepID=UPI001C906DA6|nr:uncharacterized protein LOC122393311 [Amphibalanus amphitrite]XP_043245160.1 uncharacterized protein LOC122393311 [Amphibalanus amphitrite]